MYSFFCSFINKFFMFDNFVTVLCFVFYADYLLI
jgi:hypothetical protein